MTASDQISQIASHHGNVARLSKWIGDFSCGCASDPMLEYPRDYDGPCDFLLDLLRDCRDESVRRRFGDAACLAFRTLVTRGYFVRSGTDQPMGATAGDLLFLVEALPCSQKSAEETVDCLMLLVAGNLQRPSPGDDTNLHRRILLALSSKIPICRARRHELARLFEQDLRDKEYTVAAFGVMLRLDPLYAAKHLPGAIQVLRRANLPSRYLIADVMEALRLRSLSVLEFLSVYARLTDVHARREVIAYLHRMNRDDLSYAVMFQGAVRQPPALKVAAAWGSLGVGWAQEDCRAKARIESLGSARHARMKGP